MLAHRIPHDPYLSIVDSFPVPVCRSFGEVARHIYYGLRAHVRLAWPGVLVDCALAPAHLPDTDGAEEVLQGVAG